MFLRELHGLRGIAVIIILLFHFFPKYFPGGFMGVDVFFVLSGFLVTKSIIDNFNAERPIDFLKYFYSRRIARILPISLLMSLLALLLTLFFSNDNPPRVIAFFVSSVLGYSNIKLFMEAHDYFSIVQDFNFFTHTWSLGVEEQFYVVFSIIFCISIILGKRLKKWDKFSIFLFLISVTTLFSIFFDILLFTTGKARGFSFYMIPVRWWELSIGVIIAVYLYKIRLKPEVQTELFSRLKDFSLFAIICSLFIDYKSDYFPFPIALIPVLSTAIFCFYSDTEAECVSNRFLNFRLLQWFGSISFSLYLLHWIIIVMLKHSYGEDYFIVKVFALLITIFGASLIYKYVERPFNRYLRKSYIKSFGFAAIVFISLFTIVLINNNNYFKYNWLNLRNFVDVELESKGEELVCHGREDMEAFKNPFESCLKPLSVEGKKILYLLMAIVMLFNSTL